MFFQVDLFKHTFQVSWHKLEEEEEAGEPVEIVPEAIAPASPPVEVFQRPIGFRITGSGGWVENDMRGKQ
jgi:hypothetical protein